MQVRRINDAFSSAASWKIWFIEISETDEVSSFMEKPQGDGSWINGGFVCEPEIIDYVDDDLAVLEQEPL